MKSRSIPSRVYDPGLFDFDIPPSSQKKFIGVQLTFTRESWSAGVDFTLQNGVVVPNTALVVRMMRTLDNGASWLPVGEATFPGGIQLNRDGSTRLTDSWVASFTDGAGHPLAQDGDLRIEAQPLITLQTAVNATMLEPGD